MPLGVSHVSIGHVEADNLQSRPGLLHAVEKSPSTTADVEQAELALIASGKYFVERWQGLAPHCIRCAVEQDLDLGVIALSRLICQPAARLKVEILQIVARPRAAGVVIENFAVGPLFSGVDGPQGGPRKTAASD
jgi:hypothetical protein